ncbi:hypothetical protein ACFPFV_12460 [Salinicoccus siamensis]
MRIICANSVDMCSITSQGLRSLILWEMTVTPKKLTKREQELNRLFDH